MRISKNEVKYLRSLSQKKHRDIKKKFVLEGWKALKEVLNSPYEVDYVAVLPRYLEDADYQSILKQVADRKIPLKELSEVELRQVSNTVHAQGVVALVAQRETALDEQTTKDMRLIVAADAVSDPGNIGSILRSADWFGVDLVLLGKGCVELYNEKVVRSTAGSLFHLAVVEDIDLPGTTATLKKQGFPIAVLSADGRVSYNEFDFGERSVLVFGSEAHGVSKEVRNAADTVVKIPKYGRAESLNVGVACGIVLAHVRTRQKGK